MWSGKVCLLLLGVTACCSVKTTGCGCKHCKLDQDRVRCKTHPVFLFKFQFIGQLGAGTKKFGHSEPVRTLAHPRVASLAPTGQFTFWESPG